MKDFKNFQEAPGVVGNARFFCHYPEMAGNILRDIYDVPAGPKERLYPTIRQYITMSELWSAFKDMREVTRI